MARTNYKPPVIKEDAGDVEWYENSATAMCKENLYGDCQWAPRDIRGVNANVTAAKLHTLETGHDTKVEMQAARIINFTLEG